MFLIILLMLAGFCAIIAGFICMYIGRSIEGFFSATLGAALVMFITYVMGNV